MVNLDLGPLIIRGPVPSHTLLLQRAEPPIWRQRRDGELLWAANPRNREAGLRYGVMGISSSPANPIYLYNWSLPQSSPHQVFHVSLQFISVRPIILAKVGFVPARMSTSEQITRCHKIGEEDMHRPQSIPPRPGKRTNLKLFAWLTGIQSCREPDPTSSANKTCRA